MDTTVLARLLSRTDPQTVLYTVNDGHVARVYRLHGGVIYMDYANDSGSGCMQPLRADRATWARTAEVCAWTAPANPATMQLGGAGQRLGAFWRSLPSEAAAQAVSAAQLLQVAQAAPVPAAV